MADRPMAAKDIDTATLLGHILRINEHGMDEATPTWDTEPRWAYTWDLAKFYPDVPWKVMEAKLSKLIRSGLLDGCVCGCRGDFTVTSKGRVTIGPQPNCLPPGTGTMGA